MSEPNEANRDDQKKENDQSKPSEETETKPDTPIQSGDPGRTPGSAEGDEETIDEDIRQKEAEGKL